MAPQRHRGRPLAEAALQLEPTAEHIARFGNEWVGFGLGVETRRVDPPGEGHTVEDLGHRRRALRHDRVGAAANQLLDARVDLGDHRRHRQPTRPEHRTHLGAIRRRGLPGEQQISEGPDRERVETHPVGTRIGEGLRSQEGLHRRIAQHHLRRAGASGGQRTDARVGEHRGGAVGGLTGGEGEVGDQRLPRRGGLRGGGRGGVLCGGVLCGGVL